MNIRILISTAASLALVAAAIPTVALAKDSAATAAGTETSVPRVMVIAQDSGDTGGDKDHETACAQTNSTANEVLDAAGAAFGQNDMETGFAMLDLLDAVEADAAAEGCTIKYT